MAGTFGIEHITKSKTAAGLEIFILPDGSHEISVAVLKKEKSSLLTAVQKSGIKSIEEAAAIMDVKIPLILVLNGKGIIHKKVNISEQDSPATLLNKVLPNASLQDFCVQQTPLSTSESFVSVIRTSVLNELLNELNAQRLKAFVACFLGPFTVNNLLGIIDQSGIDNEMLSTGRLQLQIREQQITEVIAAGESVTAVPVKVGDDKIPAQELIAFAAAMSYFVSGSEGILNSDAIGLLKEDYTQQRKFEFRGWAFLISVFTLLLINYFVFNNYWTKSSSMNATLSMNESAVQRCEQLKKEVADKKEFLEQNGLLENSRTSYYADRIAESLPASIQLTEMNIHPLKKKAADDVTDNLFFENKRIAVSGKCQRSTGLNDWIKELKQKNWIADVVLVNYNQDNKTEAGLFFIDIKLK